MLLFFLLCCIILTYIISYIFSKKDIFSPPNILLIGFMFSTIFAILNIDTWNFDMGYRTLGVILLGLWGFVLAFYVSFYLFNGRNKISKMNTDIPKISNIKIILFIVIQVISLILVYNAVMNIASMYGGGDSLGENIFLYRTALITKSDDFVRLPTIVSTAYDFSYYCTFYIIYMLLDTYYIKKKVKKIYLLNIGITILIALLLGNRGDTIFLILGFFIIKYVFEMRKNSWKLKLNFKLIIKYILIGIVLLVSFPTLGLYVVGRGNDINEVIDGTFEQLSMYIGAPLKLLDLYMYTDYGSSAIVFGFNTFNEFYRWLGFRLSIVEWNQVIGNEFRYDNGVLLGNVYTMFRPFVADFGFLGVFLLSFIMGLFFSFLYSRIKYTEFIYNKYNIDCYLVLYATVIVSIVLGFFTNWFYSIVINFKFIKMIIYWKLFERCFLIRSKR